jgi:ABC-2 type transport system ATP-binding protein
MNDIAISIKNVHKTFHLPTEKATGIKQLLINKLKHKTGYTKQKVLDGISFDIKKGEFFGIVGRNGSGKSTLLKIIAEIYRPTSGEIKVHGKLVPFIELGVGFNPELTGRENIYLNGALLGFSKKEIDAIYEDIVNFAELHAFMDQKLKNYSSGMQVRLAFSVATRAKADILLVDEVLAVGDAEFQQKCFQYFKKLKESETTVVFISHSMDSVEEYCDRAMLIETGKIAYLGTPHQAAKKYLKLFGQ